MAKETALVYSIDSFKWSKEEYTLSEMLDNFADRKPFAFVVTQGYAGKKDVGADEMYWFHDIVFQSRVVGRDVNDDYLSIPLNYPHKVTPTTATWKEGPLMTVDEMVRKNMYKTFEFKAKQKHTIMKDASPIGDTALEPMEIIRTYDERFLAVHSLLEGPLEEYVDSCRPGNGRYIQAGVKPRYDLLPVYMPISIAIALDVCDDTETFERTMYDFKTYIDKQPHSYEEDLQEVADIMVFDEPPSDDDYEYIHTLHFIKARATPVSTTQPDRPDRKTKQSAKNDKNLDSTEIDAPPIPPKKPIVHANRSKKGIRHLMNRLPQSTDVASQMSTMSTDEYCSNSSKLASRVGPLAMDLDLYVVLNKIHKLFVCGTIPESTRIPKTVKPQLSPPQLYHPGSMNAPAIMPPGADLHQSFLDSLQGMAAKIRKREVTPPGRDRDGGKAKSASTLPDTPGIKALLVNQTAKPISGASKPAIMQGSKPGTTQTSRTVPQVPVKPSMNNNTPEGQPHGKRTPFTGAIKPIMQSTTGPPSHKPPESAKVEAIAKPYSYTTNVLTPGITDSSQIPENISEFSTGDIAESLRLLNLSDHVSKFLKSQVDGDLLRDLSEEDLFVGFGLTRLDAKIVVRFAHGWRPKK